MEKTKPIKTVHDIAVKTLQNIETLGLKPIPQIYELWFRYYQGDEEIVRAVKDHKGTLDEVACHKIYRRFLTDAGRGAAVKKISDQLQQAVAEMVSMLSGAKDATAEYKTALATVGDQVQKAETIEDIGTLVSVIVSDTRRMLEKNKELELQLVSSSEQIRELQENLDNVKKEAMTDGLTGLTNRKAFDKHIRDFVIDAEENDTPLTLLLSDIDHFKKFNDSYGHQVGDQVLRLVAHTLIDGIKGRDIAARYGGEEFAIILPSTPLSSAVKVGDMLRLSVEGKEIINKTTQMNLGTITLSIGVAAYRKGEGVPEFIHRADEALYKAKDLGRNRVCVGE